MPGSQRLFFLFIIKTAFILNTKQEWVGKKNKLHLLHFDHVWYLIFVKLCIPENRSLDIRNSHFPPSLSFVLIGWAPSCPVGVGLSLLLPVFLFFFFFFFPESGNSQKPQNPAGGFSPTADRFHVAHTHTHAHASYHTLSLASGPLIVVDCPTRRGQLTLEAVRDPSLSLPRWSDLL